VLHDGLKTNYTAGLLLIRLKFSETRWPCSSELGCQHCQFVCVWYYGDK